MTTRTKAIVLPDKREWNPDTPMRRLQRAEKELPRYGIPAANRFAAANVGAALIGFFMPGQPRFNRAQRRAWAIATRQRGKGFTR